MTGASPARSEDDQISEIHVTEEEVQRAKLARAIRYNTRQVPALRVLGTVLLGGLVAAHNAPTAEYGGTTGALWFTGAMLIYCGLSWGILDRFYPRVRRLDLGTFFLAVDLFWIGGAILVSGGSRSWLFFLLLIRVADQTCTTFRQVLLFAHLSVASYGLVLVAQEWIAPGSFSWGVEAVKAMSVYVASLYVATTARTAEALRQRGSRAIRAARTLIAQLRDQTTSLKEARTIAEDMGRARSQFFANVSHELRTPLASSLGFVELLQESTLTDEQQQYLNQVDASTRALKLMVDQLLDFARLEASGIALARVPFDVRALAHGATDEIRRAAAQKGLAVSVDVAPDLPRALQGDPVRVRQILSNLLDNAVKFTDRGGLALSVRGARRDERVCEVLLTVTDTGIGIPRERHDHIYDLRQLDGSSTRRHGGIGLGLALTSRLVKAMGGRIWLQSEPGTGSAFQVELPLELVAAPTLT